MASQFSLHGPEAYGIAFSILKDPNKWDINTHMHHDPQLPSPTDEKAVVRWIKDLENAQFPTRVEHVRLDIWSNRLKRPGRIGLQGSYTVTGPNLAARFTKAPERNRVEGETPRMIRTHFQDVQKVLKGVEQCDVCNVDEKGFR